MASLIKPQPLSEGKGETDHSLEVRLPRGWTLVMEKYTTLTDITVALSDQLVIPPSTHPSFHPFPQVEDEVLSGDHKPQTAPVIKASQQLGGKVFREMYPSFLYKASK